VVANHPVTLPNPAAWSVPGGHGLAADELVAVAQYSRQIGEAASAADHGFLGWTIDLAMCNGGAALSTGAQWFMKMWVPRSITVTNMHAFFSVAAATMTAGGNNMGIYNSAGTQIGATADITAYPQGMITAPLTSSLPITGGVGVFVWLAIKCSATTVAQAARAGNAFDAVLNANLTTANYRAFNNGTSAGTLLPGSITLGSSVRSANMVCLAVS
jgi:hypothetical protein